MSNSMRTRKTPYHMRRVYIYYDACGRKYVLEPGKDGVTAEYIRLLHLDDDNEINKNLEELHCMSKYYYEIESKERKALFGSEEVDTDEDKYLLCSFECLEETNGYLNGRRLFESISTTFQIEEDEAIDRMMSVIETIPDRYKEPLILKYFEGYTGLEISNMLGISPSLVSHRIFMAKRLISKDRILRDLMDLDD